MADIVSEQPARRWPGPSRSRSSRAASSGPRTSCWPRSSARRVGLIVVFVDRRHDAAPGGRRVVGVEAADRAGRRGVARDRPARLARVPAAERPRCSSVVAGPMQIGRPGRAPRSRCGDPGQLRHRRRARQERIDVSLPERRRLLTSSAAPAERAIPGTVDGAPRPAPPPRGARARAVHVPLHAEADTVVLAFLPPATGVTRDGPRYQPRDLPSREALGKRALDVPLKTTCSRRRRRSSPSS